MAAAPRQARQTRSTRVARRARAVGLWLAFCLPLCLIELAHAQLPAQLPTLGDADAYPRPADYGRLHFHLVTVDVGNRLWDNFGHSALRMRDEAGGVDLLFNWGGFDISGGMLAFGFRFFLGEMNYRLFTVPTDQAYARYRQEARSVWEDRIHLNNAEKARLYQRLMWNLEPENLGYQYDYFDDNCTTRLRDYLDEALDGRLRGFFTQQTETSYRQLIWSHFGSLAVVAMLLDLGMNSNIDRPISEWESMFLPLNLRRSLARVDSDVARGGAQLPLLDESRVVMQFQPPTRQWNAYAISTALLVSLSLLPLLSTRRPRHSRFLGASRNRPRSLSKPGYLVLGALTLAVASFSGILGCLMLFGWLWSGHADLHHNVNLLLFWPTDLIGVAIALRWLILRSPWPLNRHNAPYFDYYLLAHLLGILVYAVVDLGGLVEQDLSRARTWLLGPLALIVFLIWRHGFRHSENAIVL